MGAIELEVVKPVSQSYLTKLWNNEAFATQKGAIKTFSDTASKYFSIALLLIALLFGAAHFAGGALLMVFAMTRYRRIKWYRVLPVKISGWSKAGR